MRKALVGVQTPAQFKTAPDRQAFAETGMKNVSFRFLALIASLFTFSLVLILTSCASEHHAQITRHLMDDDRTLQHSDDRGTYQHQHIEDSRTAERAREALAAGIDYRYDGVKITAANGVVQLSGFVNTNAQRINAEAITRKIIGVESVENYLTVKN